jgi:transcriptional regulator with XRE-family HTH domain
MTETRDTSFDPKMIEAEENLLIDYQFLLQERMAQKGISQSELAELAGISKARLSQVLSDEANPTVETLADLFYALGERIHVSSSSLTARTEAKLFRGGKASGAEWLWVEPVRLSAPIREELVALMKSSVKLGGGRRWRVCLK